MATNDGYKPPFKIGYGTTEPCCGLSQRTKERKTHYRGSHVDWWIYENAKPHEHFELINNFDEYYEEYRKERCHEG